MSPPFYHAPISYWRIALCVILSLFLFNETLLAQKNFTIAVAYEQADTKGKRPKLPKLAESYPDSIAVVDALREQISAWHGAAYLEASVDSLILRDSSYTAFLHTGQPYHWATLRNGNIDELFLEAIGFRQNFYDKRPFHYTEVVQLQEALLQHAENNGYPFASVALDSIDIHNNEISATINFKNNNLITISDFNIEGNAKISKQYLSNYLGIEKGSLYNKAKIKKIKTRINELPFVKEKKDVVVTFKGNEATLNLFLERKKASRFDFLIGLLPNTTATPGTPQTTSRLLLTGNFNADMLNQFGRGERIFAEFKQLRPGTQELDLRFAYPFLLGLPFGVDTKFDLYKRDSTFLDVEYDFGLQYLLESGNYLKAFWNRKSSTLLTINTEALKISNMLPENLDVSNNFFGLEYRLQKLDYRFNPRKGWAIFSRGGAGFKRIRPNNQIVAISDELAAEYDSLNLNSFQFKIEGLLEGFVPLFKRSTIRAAVEGGAIFSEELVFRNEQYRVGGNKRLRGFNEESIFATRFLVFTLEYRFLIGKNAYLFVFGDQGYVENITMLERAFLRPTGIGAGISFETGVGVFGVSYAVGKGMGSAFDFRAAKIHFGYESYF